MNHIDQESLLARYINWVIRRRWLVIALVAVATAAAAAGLGGLGLSTDYRTYFSEDNPDLLAYQMVEDVYTKNDNVLFVIKPDSGTVFQPRVLQAVRDLTEDAWQIPHSTRVDAITNFQHTWAEGDNLIVEDLLPDGPITADLVTRAERVALAEPLLAGRLVSGDGSATGINVRINLPGESAAELPATVAHVRQLVEQYRAAYPDLTIHTTGIALINMAFAEAPMSDMPLVMPLMFGALLLATVAVLRSRAAVLGTLAVILMSTITALGISGHLGVFLDPTSASAPTIILTLAVADSVHILITFLQLRRSGKSREQSLLEAMVVNAQPVFLTSLTTAVGFLSLNFSDSPPFRLLGNISALGVMVAWVYSMTLLPALTAVMRSPVTAEGGRLSRWISRTVGHLVARHHRPIMAAVGLAVLGLTFGASTLRINDQYFQYFDESMAIRQGTDFTLDNLTGVYSATYSLESGESQGVSDPAFLAAVDEFTAWLQSRPNVLNVSSFSHTMKRLNRNMHGDDPAYHKLPRQQDLGAQYLLLYEMSLPYGLDVNDQINVDKSALRIDVTYGDIDVAQLEAETAAADRWLAANGTLSMQGTEGTGIGLMFAKITRRNIASMALGTAVGFAAIALILMVALKSFRMGLISLIPNVVPTAMAFGVWAWLVGEVGFAVSVVAGLAIGIIVDDTVHFLSKYNRVRDRMEPRDAVEYAFETVGPAILANTVIVAVGFAMLGLSTFRVTAYMGLLTSLTVVAALVVDFLLLPALLISFDRRRVRDTRDVPDLAVSGETRLAPIT